MAAFIGYFRVSTDRQKTTGLGLDAQRQAVSQFVGSEKLINEYTEIESGKKHNNRPQLLAAITECRKKKATLVIAKLDRLARNVAFISAMMEGSVDFICCDNPHANRLMLHLLAAFAEHEREAISLRTKSALAQAKLRGTVLGNPRLHLARAAAAVANRTKAAPEVVQVMRERRERGDTLRAIADKLNRLGLKTTRGRGWYASTIRTELGREA